MKKYAVPIGLVLLGWYVYKTPGDAAATGHHILSSLVTFVSGLTR